MPWLASHRFYRSRSPTPGPCDALPRAHAHQLVVRVRRHPPKPDPRELPIAVDPRVLAPVPPLRPRTPDPHGSERGSELAMVSMPRPLPDGLVPVDVDHRRAQH